MNQQSNRWDLFQDNPTLERPKDTIIDTSYMIRHKNSTFISSTSWDTCAYIYEVSISQKVVRLVEKLERDDFIFFRCAADETKEVFYFTDPFCKVICEYSLQGKLQPIFEDKERVITGRVCSFIYNPKDRVFYVATSCGNVYIIENVATTEKYSTAEKYNIVEKYNTGTLYKKSGYGGSFSTTTSTSNFSMGKSWGSLSGSDSLSKIISMKFFDESLHILGISITPSGTYGFIKCDDKLYDIRSNDGKELIPVCFDTFSDYSGNQKVRKYIVGLTNGKEQYIATIIDQNNIFIKQIRCALINEIIISQELQENLVHFYLVHGSRIEKYNVNSKQASEPSDKGGIPVQNITRLEYLDGKMYIYHYGYDYSSGFEHLRDVQNYGLGIIML